MLINHVKIGDILTVQGTGYASNVFTDYVVKRITKTRIFCTMKNGTTGVQWRFNEYGDKLPKDKYVSFSVIAVNGVEWK